MNEIATRWRAGLQVARVLARAGILRPSRRPDRDLRAMVALRAWGPTLAAGYISSAVRYPDAPAIIDEAGVLTFEEVDRRTNSIARGLASAGIRPGDVVTIMCRNNRGFVEASVACSKLGANVVYLNTGFPAAQVSTVVEGASAAAIIYDEEFSSVVAGSRGRRAAFVVGDQGRIDPSLNELIASQPGTPMRPPRAPGRTAILTSGTTGAPKRVNRAAPRSIAPVAAILEAIPFQARGRTLIAAPLFHAWGFAHVNLAAALSSTLVLRSRFDAEDALGAIAEHRVTAAVVVPTMLQQILRLDAAALTGYDKRSLSVIAASGSAVSGALAGRTMDAFGDIFYVLYGSTEVAWAAVAGPADLRAAPGTVGRPPLGTVVRIIGEGRRPYGTAVTILNEERWEAPAGVVGEIFVDNELVTPSDTGDIPTAVGLPTGDLGHFDGNGLLYVDGRADDMIITGGENVFPGEIEAVLEGVPGVVDAAVIGVPDDVYGQLVRAYVVCASGVQVRPEWLRAEVRQCLGAHKAPREIEFVEAIPRTETGKVIKRELGQP